MTTRFLLTCISSYYFHKEMTLDQLHEFIAQDAKDLYHNGVEEPCTHIENTNCCLSYCYVRYPESITRIR